MKTALITGIRGMDGSHLADLLLSKGYRVFGTIRRTSLKNYTNIEIKKNFYPKDKYFRIKQFPNRKNCLGYKNIEKNYN